MSRVGYADLPLHPGKAPRWLFGRMVKLAAGISEVMVMEYGRDTFLRRLSDPFWFQALACVLGFDWHSSGCTTVTCGALKEALRENDVGVSVAGGKGRVSRMAPEEIAADAERLGISGQKTENMVRASRMSAKVDNTALQDGHPLYHHAFFLTEDGKWAVVQQGLNRTRKYARRYHWLSDDVRGFVENPRESILGSGRMESALDMTAGKSEGCRKASLDITREDPKRVKRLLESPDILLMEREDPHPWFGARANPEGVSYQSSLLGFESLTSAKAPMPALSMPVRINWDTMRAIYDFCPRNYEELLGMRGVGPKTVRALALISDLVHGESPSFRDPVKYSFAVGGKDGVPYPVDRKVYDQTVEIIRAGIDEARLGRQERLSAFRRLESLVPNTHIPRA